MVTTHTRPAVSGESGGSGRSDGRSAEQLGDGEREAETEETVAAAWVEAEELLDETCVSEPPHVLRRRRPRNRSAGS
jgi:hypothetical protein